MAVKNNENSKGMSLAGLIVSMAIITTALVALLSVVNYALKFAGQKEHLYQANFMAHELMEGVRDFRDRTEWDIDGIGIKAIDFAYHLEKTGAPEQWDVVAGQEVSGIFTKKIKFFPVNRDAVSDDIVSVGGSLDDDTKRVEISVSWTEKGVVETIDLTAYLTNWQ